MNVDLSFISGIMLGFELLNDEACDENSVDWGFVVDLGIVRLIVTGVNE